jgi:hypothetical protein
MGLRIGLAFNVYAQGWSLLLDFPEHGTGYYIQHFVWPSCSLMSGT